MLSVYKNSIVLPKIYHRSTYDRYGKFLCSKPVKKLFTIWKYRCYLTIYHRRRKGNEYSQRAINLLKQYVNIKKEINEIDNSLITNCYSKQDGSYLGDPQDVLRLINMDIIEFYKSDINYSNDDIKKTGVSSIGFNPKSKRWYGWSHRAMSYFDIGFEVKKEHDLLCGDGGWIKECDKHKEYQKIKPKPGFIAETLKDCRYLASCFSESIS